MIIICGKGGAFLDEKSILLRAQDGDSESFSLLIEKYKDAVFTVCFAILKDYHNANDAAQDTFIKAYKNIKKFKFDSSFQTYITRIAINTCKDEFRKLSRQNGNLSIDSDENLCEIKDTSDTPEKAFEKKERRDAVRNAIASLPQKYREVIVLRDINGIPYEEIAKILKTSQGTVKSRINRARSALKEILQKDGTFL